MKRFLRLLAVLGTGLLVLALAGCPQPTDGEGDDTPEAGIDFFEDFALIPFDLDGDSTDGSDTSYDFDGKTIDDVVSPAGGRILSYDPDGDGTADKVDGKYLRLVSGRFAFDESDTDYSGLTDEINFTDDSIWYLNGTVFIGENDQQTDDTRPTSTVLDIEAGTEIRGIASQSTPGTLVIDRNGQINAVGTSSDPIVFTSSKPSGSRSPGDWGGIVINGSARVQKGTASGEGGTGTYGGPIDTDDSGTLRYVVVQFAGTLFTPDNELNGIAFQGVGSGTDVSYIQVHKNADDGVEFFGGSVDVEYVLLTGTQDDGLDGDDGWNGSAQFVIIHNYGDGANAIEADGDAPDPGDPVAAANAILANITIIGGGTDNGPNFKSAANYDVYNTIILNYPAGQTPLTESTGAGADIDYFGVGIESDLDLTGDSDPDTTGTQEYAEDWNDQVGTNGNFQGSAGSVATGMSFSNTSPDYVPATLGGATAQAVPATNPHGTAMQTATYLGAIDVGGTDWTAGWTSFPTN